MNIQTLIAAIFVSVLSACGGGDEDKHVPVADTYVPVIIKHVPATDKYVGTWSTCNNNHMTLTVTFTSPSPSYLSYTILNNIYENANCSGAIVGRVDFKSPVTFTYNYTRNFSIYNKFNVQPFIWYNEDLDIGNIRNNKMTVLITGTGVKTVNSQQCVFWSPTGSICFDGTEGNPDYIGDAGFMVSGNTLSVALPVNMTGAAYSVASQYYRK